MSNEVTGDSALKHKRKVKLTMFTGDHGGFGPGECLACGRQSLLIAAVLSACADCIRERPEEVLPRIQEMQAETRLEFDRVSNSTAPKATPSMRLGMPSFSHTS